MIGDGAFLKKTLGDKWGDRVFNVLGGIFIAVVAYSMIYLPIANHYLGEDNHTQTQKVLIVDRDILPYACNLAKVFYPAQHLQCLPLPHKEKVVK